MIQFKKGNILTVTEGIIFHGVNCKGVMGSGLALQIREKYPEVYEVYREQVREVSFLDEASLLAKVQIVAVSETLEIGNIFSQVHYGRVKGLRYVSYDALDNAFQTIKASCDKTTPLHFPRIGSGLAQGNPAIIQLMIEQHLSDFNVFIWDQE